MHNSPTIPLEELIGAEVVYLDYLGYQRPGKIAFYEPYAGSNMNAIDQDGEIVWVYIVDDDPDYNLHSMEIAIAGELKNFMYAELRLSTEVYIQPEN